MRIQILVVGLFAGCGGGSGESTVDAFNACATETRADTFVVGLDKHGVAGSYDFALMSIDPAPPSRGNNTWIVQISSMSAKWSTS